MSVTVSIEEAQARLAELISSLQPNEELVITKDEQPIARLVAEPRPPRAPRQPGSARGILTILKEDQEHLEHFKEYMP